MLIELSCNKKGFKTIKFQKGLNIILADCEDKKFKDSTKTRNGVGKSTIIELIHFCLGANFDKEFFESADFLESCCFSLTVNIAGKEFIFTRNVNDYKKIFIAGDTSQWPIETKLDAKFQKKYLSVKDFNICLGTVIFELDLKSTKPSFRELISYIIRKEDGFKSPFTFFSKQKNIDIQHCNAFFLSLNLECVDQFEKLAKKETGLTSLAATLKSGILGNELSSAGALNAEIASLATDIEDLRQQLQSFSVHPQYNELSQKASQLTTQIHQFTNDMISLQNLYSFYSDTMTQEDKDVNIQTITQMYQEANTIFPASVVKKLEEVAEFHNIVSKNRKHFLSNETQKILRDIDSIKNEIQKLSNERREIMLILKTQKALDEYILLQDKLNKQQGKLEGLKKDLEVLDSWQEKKSQLKIDKEKLLMKIRQDYKERGEHISNMQNIFSEKSRSLYDKKTGKLLIDIKDNGYAFDIEIQGKKSQGIKYMQIFCYDLLLMQLATQKNISIDFLIHDSTIFDGVDERQIYAALKVAYEQTNNTQQQYICLMNSDKVPTTLFDDEFKEIFNNAVILRLNDSSEEGKLFGISF